MKSLFAGELAVIGGHIHASLGFKPNCGTECKPQWETAGHHHCPSSEQVREDPGSIAQNNTPTSKKRDVLITQSEYICSV